MHSGRDWQVRYTILLNRSIQSPSTLEGVLCLLKPLPVVPKQQVLCSWFVQAVEQFYQQLVRGEACLSQLGLQPAGCFQKQGGKQHSTAKVGPGNPWADLLYPISKC
jgi:hypothetical protein